jgi:hypothetical protein
MTTLPNIKTAKNLAKPLPVTVSNKLKPNPNTKPISKNTALLKL